MGGVGQGRRYARRLPRAFPAPVVQAAIPAWAGRGLGNVVMLATVGDIQLAVANCDEAVLRSASKGVGGGGGGRCIPDLAGVVVGLLHNADMGLVQDRGEDRSQCHQEGSCDSQPASGGVRGSAARSESAWAVTTLGKETWDCWELEIERALSLSRSSRISLGRDSSWRAHDGGGSSVRLRWASGLSWRGEDIGEKKGSGTQKEEEI